MQVSDLGRQSYLIKESQERARLWRIQLGKYVATPALDSHGPLDHCTAGPLRARYRHDTIQGPPRHLVVAIGAPAAQMVPWQTNSTTCSPAAVDGLRVKALGGC